MGNIFGRPKYRIINDQCMIDLEAPELRRYVTMLQDEIAGLKSTLHLLEDRQKTDKYNNTERMNLIQKDLESLVCNDKLLLEEINRLKQQILNLQPHI